MHVTRALAAVATAGTVVAIAAAGPAAASTGAPSTLAQAKWQAQRTIARDLSALRFYSFVTKVDRNVPTADQATLQAQLTAGVNALTALRMTVQNETTIDAVQADLTTSGGYHLTDFVFPQTVLVLQSDDLLAAAGRDAAGEPALQAEITAAQTAGKDVAGAQNAYNDYVSKVSAAQSGAQSVHDTTLALTVADAPGNETTLHGNGTSLRAAGADLLEAGRDAATIKRLLAPAPVRHHLWRW